jgi:hypothetical protein
MILPRANPGANISAPCGSGGSPAWRDWTGEGAVTESKSSFISGTPRGNSPVYVAELAYSYSVTGKTEAGFYKRQFSAEADADEFVRDLRGKAVPVQYNPNKPSQSLLSESSIESLLQTRAPKPQSESPTSADSVPDWVKPLLSFAVGLSAIGLVVSFWVHLGAVMGRRVAPEALFWILHMGIFVVWIPAAFVAKARVGNVNRKDFWKVVLQGSPDWMRYILRRSRFCTQRHGRATMSGVASMGIPFP